MTPSIPLPYDTGPQDEPDGHSFAAAWWALTGFGVLSATLIVGLFSEAAIYKLFG